MKSEVLKIVLGITMSVLYLYISLIGFLLAYVHLALLMFKNHYSLRTLLMILIGIIITIVSTIIYKHLYESLYKGEKQNELSKNTEQRQRKDTDTY